MIATAQGKMFIPGPDGENVEVGEISYETQVKKTLTPNGYRFSVQPRLVGFKFTAEMSTEQKNMIHNKCVWAMLGRRRRV